MLVSWSRDFFLHLVGGVFVDNLTIFVLLQKSTRRSRRRSKMALAVEARKDPFPLLWRKSTRGTMC